MNARWLQHLSDYVNSQQSFHSAKRILSEKSNEQSRYSKEKYKAEREIGSAKDIQRLLLVEARIAKRYWKFFAAHLNQQSTFRGRWPRSDEPVNKLLDIGYHQLNTAISKIFNKYELDPVIGLFHKARSKKSKPLVYDIMELFRVEAVDKAVAIYFRRKKKEISHISQRDIGRFVQLVKKRMQRKYYVKEFKTCLSLEYIIELQILKFVKAVNKKEVFEPMYYSRRHENRCKKG